MDHVERDGCILVVEVVRERHEWVHEPNVTAVGLWSVECMFFKMASARRHCPRRPIV